MELEIRDLVQLKEVVAELLPFFREYRVILLHGQMGSGKTTFVQEALRQLGVEHPEGSPTYALVNVYDSEAEGRICHLDLYRLRSREEAYDIGMEEILDGSSLCFIEWPEQILDFLDGPYLELNLSVRDDLTRRVQIIKKTA